MSLNSFEPGITRALARDRASRVADLRYAIRFVLQSDPSLPLAGTVRITFSLTTPDAPLALDFAPNARGSLEACSVNGTPIEARIEQGHLVLPASFLRTGSNEVLCGFNAGDGPLNRRDGYLYTVFVPARAHEAFPCFDQPDLKARWTLTLEGPAAWQVVSNTEVAQSSPWRGTTLDEPSEADRVVTTFHESVPLSTYLFAFAAGEFDITCASCGDRSMRIYHRSGDTRLLADNLVAIEATHAAALQWLEDYTAVPYPFGKFDIVLIPAFQFGGMEHPGAIFYNESSLLLQSSVTQQQELARATLIAHETAHMWFGDLVTMTWFDDVWMKEVFANYLAARIANPRFRGLDHDLFFLQVHYPSAYDVDRTAGSHPIRQDLDNLADAASLYGPIVYLKSPVVMRQLELIAGEPAFQLALREYISSYAFGTAAWPDILEILSRHVAIDLRRWSRDWIEQHGRPRIDVDLAVEDGLVMHAAVRASEPGAGRHRTWPQWIDIAAGDASNIEHTSAWLDGLVVLEHLHGRPAPEFLLPAGRGLAYGDCHLDARSRAWLVQHLPDVRDDLTRGSAWLALWDAMLNGDLANDVLFDLAMRLLPAESSELNLQRLLTDLHRLFWQFQPPEYRRRLAARLEHLLMTALDEAPSRTRKASIFAALRAVATTERTWRWLRAVWIGEASIGGLDLGEADRIELAKALAVRVDDVAEWRAIVDRQVDETASAERRAALAFLAPALSPDPDERAKLFGHLSEPEHRRREPWVVEAARWLHHPLRAEAAIGLVAPALELVEELKRTGDIFLPMRWLEATLGLHRSPAAAEEVGRFLTTRPAGYSPAITRMVLASADYLFRAAAFTPR